MGSTATQVTKTFSASPEEWSSAGKSLREFYQDNLVEPLLGLLGYYEGKECATTLDPEACAWTAAMVLPFGLGRVARALREATLGIRGVEAAARAADSADNVANGRRLAEQLGRESAESAFTRSGQLKPEVMAGSQRIIEGSNLRNPDVVRALTADGSNIADWGKYTSQTFQSPSGSFQVHFYYNRATGVVNYSYDYKVVFNGRR